MIQQQPIKFQQERDFGQIFNATFTFIRQEYKKLGGIFIRFCGPLIILTVIATIMYQNKVFGMAFNPMDFDSFDDFAGIWGLLLLLGIVAVANYAMVATTIYSYISLYATFGPDGFGAENVWQKISENYFKVLGIVIVGFLIISFGTVLCVLPGIYFSISLSLWLIGAIHEKKGFGDAFSRSFEITHERWWWTLLLIFVIYLIVGLVGMIFSLPASIITMVSTVHSVSSGEFNDGMGITLSILNAISAIISQVLNIIPFIALSFQYFAIVETKDKPSLMNRIDQIS